MDSKGYGSIRVGSETFAELCQMKDALEACQGRRLTMDDVLKVLLEGMENGNSDVWKVYQRRRAQSEELLSFVRERK